MKRLSAAGVALLALAGTGPRLTVTCPLLSSAASASRGAARHVDRVLSRTKRRRSVGSSTWNTA